MARSIAVPPRPGMPMAMPWHAEGWSLAARASAPSMLLHGPAGIGERMFALALAASWLCETPLSDTRQPCGQCPGCRLIDAGNHPDLRLIEPEALAQEDAGEPDDGDGAGVDGSAPRGKAKGERKPSQDIRIEQMRHLSELAQLSSHRGGARVVVIHPADAMNIAASNALLKLLEEPPSGMRFVLVANRVQRISATVLSRCMRVALRMPSPEESIAWLTSQGVEDAVQVLSLAGGAPQIALANTDPVRAATYRSWLQIVESGGGAVLTAARDTKDAGPPQVLAWLLQWTHDLAQVKAGSQPRYYPQQAPALERLATGLTLREITRLHRTLALKQRWIRHPVNPQLTLEALWIDYFQGVDGH